MAGDIQLSRDGAIATVTIDHEARQVRQNARDGLNVVDQHRQQLPQAELLELHERGRDDAYAQAEAKLLDRADLRLEQIAVERTAQERAEFDRSERAGGPSLCRSLLGDAGRVHDLRRG